MRCPNCGWEYQGQETRCQQCNTPLSNASYVQIKKKRRWPLITFIILLILSAGSVGGYIYYINRLQEGCREATIQIFEHAKQMDFSDVNPKYLPEELKSNPNIKERMEEELNRTMAESNLISLINLAGIEIDTDQICQDITKNASYEITDVTADYRSCTVTVHTKNVDYSQMSDTIYKEVKSQLSDTTSIWEAVKHTLSDFLFGSKEEEEEEHDYSVQNLLSSLYEKAKSDCPEIEATGTIVYGFKDKTFTILSVDEELFSTYYGFPKAILSNMEELPARDSSNIMDDADIESSDINTN